MPTTLVNGLLWSPYAVLVTILARIGGLTRTAGPDSMPYGKSSASFEM
jgi:hypothetical protein